MASKKKVRIETSLRESVLNDVVELEKRVWKKEGYREVNAPMLYFELAYLTNGMVITAFDEGIFSKEERKEMAKEDPWYEGDHPIGFLCCFANFDNNGSFWYGARMGVDQLYQDKNVGEVILYAWYESAKKRNIPRVRWTYDPFVSKNAYLYLQKMGVQIEEIGFNYYSAVFTNDELNKDISTDRFVVDWYVSSERVRDRMDRHIYPTHDLSIMTPENTLNEIVINEDGLETHGEKMIFNADQTPLFIEIPYSHDRLLKVDRKKAQELRDQCRTLFMRYLAAGYVIKEFVTKKEPSGRIRSFYQLDLDPRYGKLKKL